MGNCVSSETGASAIDEAWLVPFSYCINTVTCTVYFLHVPINTCVEDTVQVTVSMQYENGTNHALSMAEAPVLLDTQFPVTCYPGTDIPSATQGLFSTSIRLIVLSIHLLLFTTQVSATPSPASTISYSYLHESDLIVGTPPPYIQGPAQPN